MFATLNCVASVTTDSSAWKPLKPKPSARLWNAPAWKPLGMLRGRLLRPHGRRDGDVRGVPHATVVLDDDGRLAAVCPAELYVDHARDGRDDVRDDRRAVRVDQDVRV